MKTNKFIFAFLFLLIVMVVVAFRLIPHPANFTPIGAVAILLGMWIRPRLFSLVISIGMLFISDLIIGFYPGMFFVYLAYALTVLFSSLLLDRVSWTKSGVALLSSSLIFFLVSNFGVWLQFGLYPKTVHGLWECYIAAIPFLKNSLMANLSFGFAGLVLFKYLRTRNMLQLNWVS